MMQLTSLSVGDRALGGERLEGGQAQAEQAQRAGVEEVAAGQAVAELGGLRGRRRGTWRFPSGARAWEGSARASGLAFDRIRPDGGAVKRRPSPDGSDPREVLVRNSSGPKPGGWRIMVRMPRRESHAPIGDKTDAALVP